MKSTPSANSKATAKVKTRRKPAPKKRKPEADLSNGPFQGLSPESASLLQPLVLALESELSKRGLIAAEVRHSTPAGISYRYIVERSLGVVVDLYKPNSSPHLMFSIEADIGRALKDPSRMFLLESLLELNLGCSTQFRIGLDHQNLIRVVFSARVFDQLSISGLGELMDRMMSYACYAKDRIGDQRAFVPIDFEAPAQMKPQESEKESPGPNGWVH